jgi:hypothetical protein
VFKSFCDTRDRWEQARNMCDLIDELTPLAVDEQLVLRLRKEIHEVNSAFCYVPDRYSETLEVIMAGVDKTRANYRPDEAQVGDYQGGPAVRRSGKPPVAKPPTAESVAQSILLDLCEGHMVGFASHGAPSFEELIAHVHTVLQLCCGGVNKGRTLYCFHTLPEKEDMQKIHTQALVLIREKLDAKTPADPELRKEIPRFVFLLLAPVSQYGHLRPIILDVYRMRFKQEELYKNHGTSQ